MRSRSSASRRASQVFANVGWGVLVGGGVAVVLSVWVLGISLLRGSTRFETYGMTTWSIILTYLAAGTGAGALVGLLRPLTQTRLGGAVVGALAGIMIYGAIGTAMDGWTEFDPQGALVLGIPIGGIGGWWLASQQ